MPEFGQCSEPFCSEIAARLFDCTHHCMKLVCLQHLIEHDRLIEHNEDYLNNLRIELQQLWTTYSLLVDETKLRLEFEHKLKKHQQLIRDISNLFENNSNNIEHYRFMMEKLKFNIEQEKQLNQYSTESFPHIESVKIEPMDQISTTDELDSLEVSLATRIERFNNDIEQQQRESISDSSSIINEYDQEINNTYESSDNETISNHTINCPAFRKLSGECPFWMNGAYGLTEDSHGMYLCPHRKYGDIYRHLMKFHKLKLSSIEIICQAIQNHKDPSREILFRTTDIVIDQINNYRCPFSIHNDQPLNITNLSKYRCRTIKPQLAYALRYHLTRDHQMSIATANKLVYNLKTNCQDLIKN